MRLGEKKKIALVLSGGGIKAAAFHLGVCLALREKGFQFAGGSPEEVSIRYSSDRLTFKIYVGSSAGAFVSTWLAAGYSIDAIIDAFERGSDAGVLKSSRPSARVFARMQPLSYRDVFSLNSGNLLEFIPNLLRQKTLVEGGIEALIKSGFRINGLFTTRNIARYLSNHILKENTFTSLGVKLYITATQLNHSRKTIFGSFPETTRTKTIEYANFATISDAVAASTSLPPVFAPYAIRNEEGKEVHYFDGEIRDTLSTHMAAEAGADLVIASYSIQPYHFTPEMGSLHTHGIPLIFNQALYQVVQQKIEKHIEHQQQISAIMSAVDGYFRQTGLPDEHRERLLQILEKRVGFRPDVDYIYIHPSPDDHEMFFVDHFSLNPKILARIVNVGFRAALQILRKHDL